MAAVGGLSESVLRSSDNIHEFSCTPCSEDGKDIEAVNFCEKCQTFFCGDCLRHHNKVFKSHKLLDKAAMKTRNVDSVPMTSSMSMMDECDDHPGNFIQMYCGDHDIVCCTVCIAVDHRPCKDVNFIPKAAKALLKEQDRNKTKISLETICRDIELFKLAKSKEILILENAEKEILAELQTIKDRIIARIHELEKQSIANVHIKFKETTNLLKDEILQLDKQLLRTRNLLSSFIQVQSNEDATLFVKIKQGQKEITKSKELLSELKTNPRKMSFMIEGDIETPFRKIESFGSILEHDYKYSASLISEHDIKDITETEKCISLGPICVLDNGHMLMTDYYNNKLRKLDEKFTQLDFCKIMDPFCVCRTGSDKVAVSLLDEGKISFVKIEYGKLTCTQTIKVDTHCMGLAFSQDELFVACGHFINRTDNKIKVYNLNGSLLRSMPQTTFLRNLSFNSDGTKLYVACNDDGLVILDRIGTIVSRPSDTKLESINSVYHDSYDNVFVCSEKRNTVLQIDENGHVKSEILKNADGIEKPLSVTIMNDPLRLIVTSRSKTFQILSLT